MNGDAKHDAFVMVNVSASAPGSDQNSSKDLEIISESETAEWVEYVSPQLFDWEKLDMFEVYRHTRGHPLYTTTLALLEHFKLLEGWKISKAKAMRYLLLAEQQYQPNPYHNNTHAADVTQSVGIILKSFLKHSPSVQPHEIFGVILAAAVHDLGHMGVNNDFLINTRHERAVVYNDRSVNENYHVSTAFQIALKDKDANIFDGLAPDEFKRVRQIIIGCVLTTDMAVHFDLLERFDKAVANNPNTFEWVDKLLVYQMIVHLADLANPSRPFELARKWAERVVTEFLEQGKQEAAVGLPVSPMCNPSLVCMPRAQLNFISIFLKPTLEYCRASAPEFVNRSLQLLDLTVLKWDELEKAGVS